MKRDLFFGGSLRFSLRTMLLFALVVSGPIAMIVSSIANLRRQEAVMETLRQRGIALFNLHEGPLRGEVMHAHLEGKQFTDADIASLSAFGHLEYLKLDHTAITGNGLDHLNGLGSLKSVDLRGTPVRGVDLARLRQLRSLKVLTLSETPVDDADMPLICGLKGIQVLELSRTNVTDAGLSELRRLPELVTLVLAECQGITAQAAIPLAACKQLEFLDVSGTLVTEAAIEQMLRFPKLRLLTVGSTISDDAFEKLRRTTFQKCELRRY